jgi:alkylation response protein AidB-like acyl-CoA dehydrogenase
MIRDRAAVKAEGSNVSDSALGAADEELFRERCGSFLRAYPFDPSIDQDAPEAVDACRAYQAALFEAGLAGLTYPRQWGGQGLTSRHQQIWREESAGYPLPTRPIAISHGMCLPVLNQFGTDEQKQTHMKCMIRGDDIFCQLFSEPNAGSDVASLQTKAVRDGDEWLINGQKVWTTRAHLADHGLIVLRTDPTVPKHQGLSMFIVDMRAPGVEIRPLRQLTGRSRFSEVFFTDVRVSAGALVGPFNDGWRVTTAMLMYERVSVQQGASSEGGHARADALIAAAKAVGRGDDPLVRQRLADLYIRETLLSLGAERAQSQVRAGREPGPNGSIGKLASALVAARYRDLLLDLHGAASVAWVDGEGAERAERALDTVMTSIAGGTNEIQRNILGDRVLGLPREPSVDRDVPFQDLLVNRG